MSEPLSNQFLTGKFFKKFPTLENSIVGAVFRYEKMTENRVRMTQPIRNLIAKGGRYTIITTAELPFEINSYILTQDGKMYIIEEFAEADELCPQTAFFFNSISTFFGSLTLTRPKRLVMRIT